MSSPAFGHATRYLLLPVLWLLLGSLAQAKPVFTIEASPRELKLGESLQVKLTLIQDASENGGMVDTPNLSFPQLPDFEVLGQSNSTSVVSSDNRMRMSVQAMIQLRPLKTGKLTIPSLTFPYSEQGRNATVKTEALEIRVEGGASAGPPLLWLGLGIAVCAAGIWALRRRPTSAAPPPAAPTPPVPTGLAGFEARLNQGEDPQLLLEELYVWFRALAARRSWAPHSGATDQEILTQLRYESGVPADKIETIGHFLQSCEQMRFANHDVAPDRFRYLLKLAQQFS